MNGNVMEMMTEVMVAIFFQPVGTYIEYKIWKKKKNCSSILSQNNNMSSLFCLSIT